MRHTRISGFCFIPPCSPAAVGQCILGGASYGNTTTMFPSPKPVLKRSSVPVDPEIPQFKWKDLGKEEIGRGTFGTVYLTTVAEKQVVVKKPFSASDDDSQKEFLKEPKYMISLQHDDVVQLKAFCLRPSTIISAFVFFDFQYFTYETRVSDLAEFLCHVNRNYSREGFTRVTRHVAGG